MAEQGERLALLSAEGGLFENFAGRYSKEKSVKIDLLLQAYDGAPHRVDRLSRRTSIEVAPAVRTAKKSKLRWIGLGPAAAAFAAIVPSLLVHQSAAPSHKNGERPPSTRQFDQTIRALSREIEQNPGDAELYVKRADAYRRASNLEAASKDVNRAIELTPTHAAALRMRSEIIKEQDRRRATPVLAH